ncbi:MULTISPECIES: carbohydrate ABC transporter permease [unclassified Crossiella]|uniref:carbohydrate ABC transporter permease n=1 Tax=unclassified Crossiella TaxID=2620835 RepID=UPI001FFF795F|nr:MULTISPECIES: carbohydrate ABC transporter permease [unclassified Crossiella]MCK2243083.1 carbohydrate ABC transporter permease [Crossiella sp. S99.2]MCK2256960.1 carbohydrate ABC transporter permease [Crossiella sp. S99.1]
MQTTKRPGFLVYGLLSAFLLASVFPLYFSFVVASKDNSAIGDKVPPLIPGGNLFANIARVFDTVDFWLAIQNSLIIASTVAVANVLLSSLAGFAFARLRFRGRDSLFLVVVGTAMVPTQLGVIPLYMLMSELDWYGQLQAVILPALVGALGVFMMRQACEETVPHELIEAARVDGCSVLRTFFTVALPAIRPQAAVLGMLTFMTAWNDYFWPLIVLDPNDSPTVQVAVSTLASGYYTDYSLMLTGATLGVLPVIALFLLLARHIVGGIMQGAVKG